MTTKLRTGLIGYGMAGQVFHAPLLTAVPGIELKAVVERSSERAKERYPQVEIVRDAGELLDDADIELVVVATPNDSHFALAKQALERGKHVVVDKPMTITSDEARELIALARERGRVLSTFQNRRWDGDFLTIRQVVKDGLLGRLVEYEAHFDRFRHALKPGAWREKAQPGAGILYDLGAHLIDQAVELFGLPAAVRGDVRTQREGAGADDFFELTLDYGTLRATLQAGMLVREPGPHFTLHGTTGSFVKYGLDPQEAALKAGLLPGSDGWGVEPPELWGALNTQLGELHVQGRIETIPGAYLSYYQNVYEAIVHGAELIVRPEQALQTIRIIEAALESSRRGATVPFTAE
ncbi:oxidoreductase [Paenibacillus athensensis]|uniref:Oxidoreductase n=1 Tax=Paenibacillus athensensis TaxID=1967502 RepID=A0A4Y8Q0C7_9BACL|nr:oxidoreductase [Paenibacillus athensensis]MCD1261113.1 oxidoreductase [Paenibacillus athensensis]